LEIADLFQINLVDSYLTLDSGFDSLANKELIEYHGLKPIIKPNHRGTKNEEIIEKRNNEFNELIYKQRYKVERVFAWQDTYRKLVTRYEKLECTHLGFKYLAYSLINLRIFLKSNI